MIFCLKCRKRTRDVNVTICELKRGKIVKRSKCLKCGQSKSQFVKQKGGNIDIHSLIGKFPRPKGGWTLPNHKYTGPYNPLHTQLDSRDRPLPGQEPYNQVDEIALRHDICYRDNENNKSACDRKMLIELNDMKPKGLRERIDRRFVKSVIGVKYKLGL